ncbi:uncharacterized protein LOC126789558 [Argentina anserina]|uniref:uncharacterized protein LOC126789558 n=1 Tax=Argentina anserina TaxID=57926 RepID=UPI002176589D|nr:uncharacterized protein LOC126789558 [Potentilla anserina]
MSYSACIIGKVQNRSLVQKINLTRLILLPTSSSIKMEKKKKKRCHWFITTQLNMQIDRMFMKTLHLFLLFQLCTSRDTMRGKEQLKDADGDYLVSKESKFELGFFSPGNSSHRYVGIWYSPSIVSEKTVVWVANRNNPINDTSGVLTINRYGELVLYAHSMQGIPIWSTNKSPLVQNINTSTLSAQLLDTGNLVVFQDDDNAIFSWQSFDYPTDTLIPGMKLGVNWKIGLEWVITSWKSQDNPATGDYTHRLDWKQTASPEFSTYKGSSKYWRSDPGPSASWVINQDGIYYYMNKTNGIERITLNGSEIQRFTWAEGDQQWKDSYAAPALRCDYYGHCGANSKCSPDNISLFECDCLPGFEPKYINEWNKNDGSDGCVSKRKEVSKCENGEGFVKVTRVKFPDTSIAARSEANTSNKVCGQGCLANCSCKAYLSLLNEEGSFDCLTWYDELMDILVYTEVGRDLYVRVDWIDLAEYAGKSNGFLKRRGMLAIPILCALLALVLIILSGCWWRKKKRNTTDITEADELEETKRHPELQFFDLNTLMAATNNFSRVNELGQGGFGSVYKGQLPNEQKIAVKRLSKTSGQGTEEFKNEVALIARLQHRNLVKLLGCCMKGEERMLVLEYMPNKSLDSFLFDRSRRSFLDWEKRFDIINGIARGVLYLHQDSRLRIIHRDLKTSNVLLDAEMNPKISDFGTARIFDGDQVQDKTNRVVGTYAYMSPEYAVFGRFSIKSDVFSFGIILLEVVSGKRNNSFSQEDPSMNLIRHVWDLWKEDRAMEIVDPTLESYNSDEVMRCIQVALLCLQEESDDRPAMSAIVFMLSGETSPPYPNQPAYVFRRNSGTTDADLSVPKESNSISNLTVTTVEARYLITNYLDFSNTLVIINVGWKEEILRLCSLSSHGSFAYILGDCMTASSFDIAKKPICLYSISFSLHSLPTLCQKIQLLLFHSYNYKLLRPQKMLLKALLFFLIFHISESSDTIRGNEEKLKDVNGEYLVSKESNFSLGFFSPGNSSYRYVGIWYSQIRVPEQTVVWVANRNSPINDTSGVLKINRYGELALYAYNLEHDPIWFTNISQSVQNVNTSTLSAQLLDTGNLVMFQDDENEVYAWQSFDHPTDTLIPGMKVGMNWKTGLEWVFTSWKSKDDPGTGDYSLRIYPDQIAIPQLFMYKGLNKYWRTDVGPTVFVDNQEETYYSMNDTNAITKVTVTNSVLQHLTWDDGVLQWKVEFSAPKSQCDVYGKCGANSKCNPDTLNQFECECLPGYVPKSLSDWNKRNGSGGCVSNRLGLLKCGDGDGFAKLERVKYPDTSIAALLHSGISAKKCEQLCLSNCSCTAYFSTGDEEDCFTWYYDLMDILVYSELEFDLHVRVNATVLAAYAGRSQGFLERRGMLAIPILSSVLALVLIIMLGCWWRKKNRNTKDFVDAEELQHRFFLPKPNIEETLHFFDLDTIIAATDHFSRVNELGHGGFGSVYKGKLPNEQNVAVKRLSKTSGQGIEEFKNEVALIARLQHRNLVKLLGCCIKGEERILVLEYMPNKSLDFFLFDHRRRSFLDWQRRFEIINGIARGILYLHQDSRLRIIHRDLKTSNVLLDDEMNPKISDFGMARIVHGNQHQDKTSRIVGTYGYMSPEYAVFGKFSTKSDIFSFGIIMLEIVTGQKNNGSNLDDPSMNLIGHVWKFWREGRALDIVDSTLKSYQSNEVIRCIQVALLCVQEDSKDRPSMSAVVFMLSGEASPPLPNQPAFVYRQNSGDDADPLLLYGPYSANDLTVTVMDAR